MGDAATKAMSDHLDKLNLERLTVREQEKQLEEKYRLLKKKNDILESEIERSRRSKNKQTSDDFTLVGTNKSGSIQAGLNSVSNINDLPAAKLKVLVSQLEREKILLDGQLRNMEWELDQEAKAYHVAKSKLDNAESERYKATDNYRQHQNKKQILSPISGESRRSNNSNRSSQQSVPHGTKRTT